MAGRRAPIDRLVDLAVAVPTCTLVAARRAVPLAARLGTLGTARLIGRVSEAVHERRSEHEVDAMLSAVVDEADTGVDDARPPETVSLDELPIDGYDDLAARQVVDRLDDLDLADLGRIETYEREHRNRSTVLGKIAILTA
ncbi:MAG: hypothetical protein R8G01_03435 [Ilumatobacteraceae bacterium]|nr:hypothetical protein [Ilumatobacteraceae bacterium]